jgi:hypothetical protein
MADIVSLRQAKKRRARANRERVAEQNRLLHGRSKSERSSDEIKRGRTASFLDSHRREKPDGDGAP